MMDPGSVGPTSAMAMLDPSASTLTPMAPPILPPMQQVAAGLSPVSSLTPAKRPMLLQQPLMLPGTGLMPLPPGGPFFQFSGQPGPGQGMPMFQDPQAAMGMQDPAAPPKKTQSHRFGSDGHMWRKYSHKLLQGTKTERVYYACTEKESLGCTAKKIVDRAKTRRWRGDHSGDMVTIEGAHNHPPRRFQQPPTPQTMDAMPRARFSLDGNAAAAHGFPPQGMMPMPNADASLGNGMAAGQGGGAEVSWLRPPASI